jgi:dTDP-4-dehydrorhamnose reductase
MRIIVTGASGQLGKDIVTHFRTLGHEVHGFSSKEMDITDLDKVREQMVRIKPSLIVHSAAYTQVDLAEQEFDKAFLVNGVGSRNVAMVASEIKARVVYISTDYVFDGSAHKPYNEYDLTNPQSIYGKSKLAGENYIKQWVNEYYILRTSWVFGVNGDNFVKTMLKLGAEREQINIVHDQIGSPTYTRDLAAFIAEVTRTEYFGTYHVSNSGICSWYEFAKAIFEISGNELIQVNPVTTSEFPRPAPRPMYSVMDHMGIRLNGLRELRHWKEALHAFIKENQ